MFNVKDVYSEHNNPIITSYEDSISRILQIVEDIQNTASVSKRPMLEFLHSIAKLVISMCDLEKQLSPEYFYSKSLEKLNEENNGFYKELFPENYQISYANPTFCVEIFGDRYGQLLSYFYCLYKNYLNYIFFHKIFKMEEYNQLFIRVYELVVQSEDVDYDSLKQLITSVQIKDKSIEQYYRYKEMYDKEFAFFANIVENSDLSDYRYLFRAGKYISENELRSAKFLSSYSSDKLNSLAKTIVNGYFRGFERDNKLEHLKNKSTIGLYYKIGLERLYKEIITEFRKEGLETVFLSAYSTKPNKQYDNDHKFDIALYISEEFNDIALSSLESGMKDNLKVLKQYSGILYIENFGEKLFSPERKEEILKLNEDQQKLYQAFNMKIYQQLDEYIPQSETSFCIVAFPVPEIGNDYEAIFEETVNLNMLDSENFEKIQQIMIDVLDQADYVHIKGKDNNKTDFRVKIPNLLDPSKNTNFINSGASVNIPAGEVFTSPSLSGTNGILHVEETYQNGLRYDNLELKFEDGYVTDFSCSNFDSLEDNRKYIEENLFFPHKTLPLGEFAIGTNTIAYMMSKKFGIMNLLPILIYEKTGPHFALGDTCFSRAEDSVKFNQFTQKKFCAVDNEKSILRKTDVNEAYTNKHQDIVLGFDSIDYITAVLQNGDHVDIIRDGRFTLKGTEELNIPLDQKSS
ncbi:leucyl aminopeptidase [Candidatus Heimdallarchaeota archaeon B3_Heim]|nr:MAG: leucyl aminopeptidase [Candidatus Heimdallarchaeota archaeon B3_Heim]